MARLPRDASEAVEELGVAKDATVLVVGPATGYVEALAEAVGTAGKVVVRDPPPDLSTRKKAVKVVAEMPDDVQADPVIVWVGTVQLPELGTFGERVAEGGALWIVLPKGGRDFRASVTEGEVKRALLVRGWRETRMLGLSTDSYAVRFHRRR